MKKKIILVCGDPNSINSEIIFKAWKKINESTKKRIYLIGSYNLLLKQFKRLNYSIKCTLVKNIYEEVNSSKLKIININLKFSNPFNINNKISSRFVKKSLNLAHKIALDKNVVGIINCAISKSLLSKKGIGVTEYLSKKCNLKEDSEIMLIHNKNLSVLPLTTHINLKNVAAKISKALIFKKIKAARNWYIKIFKKDPYFGILGLNPHNGELRNDSEESKIIIPAIKRIRKIGIKVNGPLVSDTVFISEFKNYDIIVGMYHDQVLTPFKTLHKFDAINVTIGLKYFRASPDHGTALNLIRKKQANALSLIKCFNFIDKLCK